MKSNKPSVSYSHIPCPETRERRVLLPNIHRLRPSHHMFCIPHSRKYHAAPRNNRNLHRIFPSFLLFPGLFHQSLLGRASTRHGSREEEIPQSWIGFLCGWGMDLHCCLHLAGIDTEPLHSGILSRGNSTGDVWLAGAQWRAVYRYCPHRGVFVAHLDLGREERDLATWRAIPAKIHHSMVRFA